MIRRPPRSTHCISSAASDVYKRQMKGQEEVVELRVPEIKPTKNLMEALRASIKTHERR